MKDFGNHGFRIANSTTEIKLAYTGFLLFAFLGYLTFGLISLLRVGPGYQDIVTHYLGSNLEETGVFPRAFGQMLEEAHFHAFIEGLILLVLAHLFVATKVRRRLKMWVVLLAYVATLSDLASPWLIRYVAPWFAWMQMTSWIVMFTSALILIGVPLYEMWLSRKAR